MSAASAPGRPGPTDGVEPGSSGTPARRRVRVVASPAVAAGFRLAGLTASEAESALDAERTLREETARPDAGIVLVQQSLYDLVPATVRWELEQRALPIIVSIPDPAWTRGKSIVRVCRQGTPFLEIVRYAKDREIDLIVLGTHGRGGLAHVLLGSVAERVVRKSPCPVLTVRPTEHQFVMP